jgi:hypothetical protein
VNLWHYTCGHSLARMTFDAYGVTILEPNAAHGLLWVTDLETPYREALGLTSHMLQCDRTRYRLQLIEPSGVRAWTEVRRDYRHLWELEQAPGVMPRHWYVSTSPERAKLVPLPPAAE